MKREARPRCPYCHYSLVAAYIQRGARISGGKHKIEKVGWYCPQDREVFTLRDFDRGRYVGTHEASREPVEVVSSPETSDALKRTDQEMTAREEPPMARVPEVLRLSEKESAINKRGIFTVYDGSDDEETLMEKYKLKELEAQVVPMFMDGIPFDEMGRRIRKSSDWAQHFVASARKKMERKGVTLPVRRREER